MLQEAGGLAPAPGAGGHTPHGQHNGGNRSHAGAQEREHGNEQGHGRGHGGMAGHAGEPGLPGGRETATTDHPPFSADGLEYARAVWHYTRVMAMAARVQHLQQQEGAGGRRALSTPAAAADAGPAAAPAANGTHAAGAAAANSSSPAAAAGVAQVPAAAGAAAPVEDAAAVETKLQHELGRLRAAVAAVPADVVTWPGTGLGLLTMGYNLLSRLLLAMAEARDAARRGEWAAAVASLRAAVDVEASGGYYEPPRQYQPIRQCLGWALMQSGDLAGAAEVRGGVRARVQGSWGGGQKGSVGRGAAGGRVLLCWRLGGWRFRERRRDSRWWQAMYGRLKEGDKNPASPATPPKMREIKSVVSLVHVNDLTRTEFRGVGCRCACCTLHATRPLSHLDRALPSFNCTPHHWYSPYDTCIVMTPL